jgi:hypothetical protein
MRFPAEILIAACGVLMVIKRRAFAEQVWRRYTLREDNRRWSEFIAVVCGSGIAIATVIAIFTGQ